MTEKRCRLRETRVSRPAQVAPSWLPSQGQRQGPLDPNSLSM